MDEQVPALRTTLAERLDNTGGCKEESPKDFRLVPASSQFFFHYCGSLLNLLRYLMISLISDISTVQRFHLFYNSEGMHLSGYSTCPVLVAERRYELADSCVILPYVP